MNQCFIYFSIFAFLKIVALPLICGCMFSTSVCGDMVLFLSIGLWNQRNHVCACEWNVWPHLSFCDILHIPYLLTLDLLSAILHFAWCCWITCQTLSIECSLFLKKERKCKSMFLLDSIGWRNIKIIKVWLSQDGWSRMTSENSKCIPFKSLKFWTIEFNNHLYNR